MGALNQNIRYGLRMLAKNPGFTAAAVVCLALGIGATTAIFSVVNAVLLRQLPYRYSERLVRLFTEFPTFPNGGLRHFWVSPPEYFDLKRDMQSYADMQGWSNGGVNLAGADQPVRATASYVTGGMLKMLGVAPERGRLISDDDDRPNAPRTAVLSYGLWQRAYGGDAGVIGRDIRLNGTPCTVVGVMPRGFAFPPGELDPPELWTPVQIDPVKPGNRGSHFLSLLALRKEGTGFAQSESELRSYMQHSESTAAPRTHAFNTKNHTLVLAGFQEEIVRKVRLSLLVLMGAVGFVLLIACVNVANLLLARAEARRREIAVRTAIGAGAGKLLQQFIAEGVLLSLAGAVLGTALAFGGLRVLAGTNAGSIPRAEEIGINWQVLLFTLGVSVATGVIFGLAPLIHTRASALHDTLKAAAGRTTGGAGGNTFRGILVTSELALALILLIGSGLMVKAFWKLQEVDAGIKPDHLLTMRVALPLSTYRDSAAITNFYSQLASRVNSLPGVASAALATGLPPARDINANDTQIEGLVPVPGGPINNIDYWNSVTPNYFTTVGAKLIEGRFLNDNDGANAPLVVVVNQALAKMYWPNQSALGHRVRTSPNTDWRTVVGVVADIKNAAVDRPAGTELFFPFYQSPGGRPQSWIVARTKNEPMSLASAVRGEIRRLDAALPVSSVGTMDDVMSTARSRPRFLTLLLTMFSSLSLILAALGIYGVISYAVVQRTSEIGIRMALGAQGNDVLRLIGSSGMKLAIAGTVIGAAGAFALTRFLSTMLFGVSAVDPLTFLAMAAALIAVTLVACYVPARRAAKVDPLVALRYE
ncbi:MAG TPA: ABC transporter permease [Candidatus Solibacter sp.]|nr:ABC transporter permease [Candidatus Solibacter sp.]